jgi:peroxiredoxin
MPRERDIQTVRQEAKKHTLNFPILVDNKKKNWDAWSNTVWPSVYLIDKQGRVRYWWYGELNYRGAQGEEFMRQKIEELLKR